MANAAPDYLSAYAAFQPKKVAVTDGAFQLDFAALDAMANRWAAALQSAGVEAGTKVIWCGPNSVEVVVLVNAARKAGAVSVPLNYRLTSDEASYVIDNSDAEVVVFDVEQTDQLQSCQPRCPKVSHWIAFRDSPSDAPDWSISLEELAPPVSPPVVIPIGQSDDTGSTMIYTSGTTGHPKGAVRRSGPDLAVVAGLIQHIGYQPDDVYLTTGPYTTPAPSGSWASLKSWGPPSWCSVISRPRSGWHWSIVTASRPRSRRPRRSVACSICRPS